MEVPGNSLPLSMTEELKQISEAATSYSEVIYYCPVVSSSSQSARDGDARTHSVPRRERVLKDAIPLKAALEIAGSYEDIKNIWSRMYSSRDSIDKQLYVRPLMRMSFSKVCLSDDVTKRTAFCRYGKFDVACWRFADQ